MSGDAGFRRLDKRYDRSHNKGMDDRNLTTKEIAERTGLAERTVHKYAAILDIPFLGTGRRKVYLWTEADVLKLKDAADKAKVGRPPQKDHDTE